MSSPQREQLDRAWEKYTAEVINTTLKGFGIVRSNDEWFRIRNQMDILARAQREQAQTKVYPSLPVEEVKFPLGNKYRGVKISEIASTPEGLGYLQWCIDNMQCLHLPDKFVEVRAAMMHYLQNRM